MEENVQAATEAAPVPSLAKGTAPALGAPELEVKTENKEATEKQESKEDKSPEATEAQEEPVKEQEEKEQEEPTKTESFDSYSQTPVSEVNELTSMLKGAGVTFARANTLLREAFTKGDTSLLDKELFEASLGENADKAYMQAKLAIMANKQYIEASVKELDTLSGGSFKELAEKIKKVATAEEREEYRQLINAGGAARKLAIKEMMSRVEVKKSTNKPLMMGENTPVENKNFISKNEYIKEMNKIKDNYSRAGMLTAEGFQKMSALDSRRMLSIKHGK